MDTEQLENYPYPPYLVETTQNVRLSSEAPVRLDIQLNYDGSVKCSFTIRDEDTTDDEADNPRDAMPFRVSMPFSALTRRSDPAAILPEFPTEVFPPRRIGRTRCQSVVLF